MQNQTATAKPTLKAELVGAAVRWGQPLGQRWGTVHAEPGKILFLRRFYLAGKAGWGSWILIELCA